jgi:hypothetical protein
MSAERLPRDEQAAPHQIVCIRECWPCRAGDRVCPGTRWVTSEAKDWDESAGTRFR